MNFSKVGILIILLSMFLLSACGEIPITFSGKSDNWSVHYEITEQDEQGKCAKDVRYFKYIGNKPTPKTVEYSLLTESGTGSVGQKRESLFFKGMH